jgi:hypothetical protein
MTMLPGAKKVDCAKAAPDNPSKIVKTVANRDANTLRLIG